MKPNKKKDCRETLVEEILTLELEPGTVLDESNLSNRFNLSRTPLREVFQVLSGQGYLTLEENRGAKVASMDLVSMRNFFATAPMIYAATARMAAENSNFRQIELLKACQTKFKSAIRSEESRTMAMLNHDFHRIIGTMADNPYLQPSYDRLLIDHTRMSQLFYKPHTPAEKKLVDTACHQHDRMIETIIKRQPEAIVKLTLDHWALSKDQIEKFVRPDPLDYRLDENMMEAG